MTTEYKVEFRAPALPCLTKEYNVEYMSQINALLRVQFTQIDNTLRDTAVIDRSEAQTWFFS